MHPGIGPKVFSDDRDSSYRTPVEGLEALVEESIAAGHTFLDSLMEDWETGETRYDGPGEGLFGAFVDGELIAIGGVSVDPEIGKSDTGRLRKIFVRSAWRRVGVGEALVRTLLATAVEGFPKVRLQAEDASAARLYERLGFVPLAEEHATHTLLLATPAQLH